MYLTIAQLIDRYGANEIVAVTNDRVSAPVDVSDLEAYAKGEDASPSADVTKVVDIVNSRILDAESFVLSYIGTAYEVNSFTEEKAPNVVRAVTAAVARYYLHENRMTQRVHQGYEDAVQWLTQAQKGANSLGVASDNKTTTPRSGIKTVVEGREELSTRVFTKGSENRFTEGYT